MITKPIKCLNAGRHKPVYKGKAIITKPIKCLNAGRTCLNAGRTFLNTGRHKLVYTRKAINHKTYKMCKHRAHTNLNA